MAASFIVQISSFRTCLETRCHFGSSHKTVNSLGYSELWEPIKMRKNSYSLIWYIKIQDIARDEIASEKRCLPLTPPPPPTNTDTDRLACYNRAPTCTCNGTHRSTHPLFTFHLSIYFWCSFILYEPIIISTIWSGKEVFSFYSMQ